MYLPPLKGAMRLGAAADRSRYSTLAPMAPTGDTANEDEGAPIGGVRVPVLVLVRVPVVPVPMLALPQARLEGR